MIKVSRKPHRTYFLLEEYAFCVVAADYTCFERTVGSLQTDTQLVSLDDYICHHLQKQGVNRKVLQTLARCNLRTYKSSVVDEFPSFLDYIGFSPLIVDKPHVSHNKL